MPVEVVMPKLGLTMEEGKIVEWRKKEGDRVTKGEILFVLETEKITYEVEAPQDGVLSRILVQEGETVPVGAVVAYIGAVGDEVVVSTPAAAPEAKGKLEKAVASMHSPIPAAAEAEVEKVKASPVAKKLAQEQGIDLAIIVGTGPGGRITREDVTRAIEEKGKKSSIVMPAPIAEIVAKEDHLKPLSAAQKEVAHRLSQSFQTAAHTYATVEVDAKNLLEAREVLLASIEEACQQRLTLTDMLVKLVAKALEENPEVNSSWTEEGILLHASVNIGVAVATETGLVVSVIPQANEKSLVEIVRAMAESLTRAKEGTMSLDDMAGGTFTIISMEMFGIDAFKSIINPPESAILSVGRIVEKPVVVDGVVKIMPRMSVTISFDHRVLDGESTSRFLQRVKELIENPLSMLA